MVPTQIKERGNNDQGNSTVLIPATLESLVAMRDAFNEAINVIQQRLGISNNGGGGLGGGPATAISTLDGTELDGRTIGVRADRGSTRDAL